MQYESHITTGLKVMAKSFGHNFQTSSVLAHDSRSGGRFSTSMPVRED